MFQPPTLKECIFRPAHKKQVESENLTLRSSKFISATQKNNFRPTRKKYVKFDPCTETKWFSACTQKESQHRSLTRNAGNLRPPTHETSQYKLTLTQIMFTTHTKTGSISTTRTKTKPILITSGVIKEIYKNDSVNINGSTLYICTLCLQSADAVLHVCMYV